MSMRSALSIAVTILVLTVFAAGISGGQGRGGGGFTQPDPIAFDDHAGWRSLFDGQSLNDWDGNLQIWHLESGAIVGISTPEKPAGTAYLIWKGGEPANFELKAEMKLEGAGLNSGIQYRSARTGQTGAASLRGYQADSDFAGRYTGQLYEQGTPRGIISWRGQVVRAEQGKRPRLLSTLGDSDELKALIKTGDWNQVHIIARGNTLIHIINGRTMSIFIDDDPTMAAARGVIALQIEGTGKVSFRNLWLKNL
jgi:3-keto-disaccharide hydrolase